MTCVIKLIQVDAKGTIPKAIKDSVNKKSG